VLNLRNTAFSVGPQRQTEGLAIKGTESLIGYASREPNQRTKERLASRRSRQAAPERRTDFRRNRKTKAGVGGKMNLHMFIPAENWICPCGRRRELLGPDGAQKLRCPTF
jgi:hypothetical protein